MERKLVLGFVQVVTSHAWTCVAGVGTSTVSKATTYDRIVTVGDIVSVTVGEVEIPVSTA